MPSDRTPRPAADTGVLLLALLLLALAVRPQIAAIGPPPDGIGNELGAGHGFVGLLTPEQLRPSRVPVFPEDAG